GQSSGACLIAEENGTSKACTDENRSWSTEYCEYNVFKQPLLVLIIFQFYSLLCSVSIEILPWIINSEMYPTEVRGIYGGTAAAANWISFLIIITVSFLITKIGGPLFMFPVIGFFVFLDHG
ncbi:hypothetical protein MKX03_020965, partial [Papaver bracteatum]